MNDVVILSNSIGTSRYVGPYVAASSARNAGYQVKILDFFLEHRNIVEYIRPHISAKTKIFAVSTTFIYKQFVKKIKVARHNYYNLLLNDMQYLHCNHKEHSFH